MERPRILVIDDDANFRKTLVDILRVKGYEPNAVPNGTEGLAFLAGQAVELAIVDLDLPDISGIEVLTRLKACYPHVEAIILTGNATVDTAMEALNRHAFSYLLKPYDIEFLLLTIRRAIEKQQAESALRDNELRLKVLLDSLPSGVIMVDPATHTIVDVNSSAVSMIGAAREEIVGRVCHRFVCTAEEGKCPVTDLGLAVESSDRELVSASGERIAVVKSVVAMKFNGREYLVENFIDVTERKRLEQERESLILALQEALNKVKTLSGLIPICASCKKIRDDKGYWNQLEVYISNHSDVLFSHGYCPDCAAQLYEELELLKKKVEDGAGERR